MRSRWGAVLAFGWTFGCVAAAVLARPLAQPLAYHDLADRRTWFGVPNFGDVASNLPFLGLGIAGLWLLRPGGPASFVEEAERMPYLLFFLAVALIFCGSTYYHWAPDNARLAWDRLPISVAETTLVCALVGERVSARLGARLAVPAALVGLATVGMWSLSAAVGAENLVPYVILQLYTAGMVLLLVGLFPPRYSHGRMWLGVAACYALARLGELGDGAVFAAGSLVSGHTLKHLFSALAVYWLLRLLLRREPLTVGMSPS